MTVTDKTKHRFARVTCPECGTETPVFVYAKSEVECSNAECHFILAKPLGGKAEILAEINGYFDE